jgi:hypothetical protein
MKIDKTQSGENTKNQLTVVLSYSMSHKKRYIMVSIMVKV